ncbi:RyR domain-containing protein [Actinoplanes sp. NPDC051411]|uniref:RyR domain-containing protein n=1 Tax=Actinoplanes sp. NPDC051411 TaxID=3155522 RepID=UPI0034323FE9
MRIPVFVSSPSPEKQGWTYGPARDDATKQHPCLVPYAQLLERERDIDRAMISQSIRAMIALGVTISRD